MLWRIGLEDREKEMTEHLDMFNERQLSSHHCFKEFNTVCICEGEEEEVKDKKIFRSSANRRKGISERISFRSLINMEKRRGER
ncbi:hypothetical protein O3M35_000054 [Rhynocoris fuscipes]|uniref:Uncharacterized protein n=1 Tax=Rhynocoris fuscipes TaxID=488301 RepID=A0AAW1DRU4_9HEMI